jgi:hypothetical protein
MNNKNVLISTLVILLMALPAIGDVVTIDPNNYAAGQNITNAVAGVQLLAVSVQPNPDPDAGPLQAFLPSLSPVFAQSVSSNCDLSGELACAPHGSNVFGYSPIRSPSAQEITWGQVFAGATCLQSGCGADLASRLPVPALLVDFATPTNSVTVEAGYYTSDGPGVEAFNSQGQLVGGCGGYPGGACATATLPNALNDGGWADYTISDSWNDIKYILVGGDDLPRPIADIRYNAQPTPTPSDWSLLAGGLLVLFFMRSRIRAPRRCR